jgi:hypothetical protein
MGWLVGPSLNVSGSRVPFILGTWLQVFIQELIIEKVFKQGAYTSISRAYITCSCWIGFQKQQVPILADSLQHSKQVWEVEDS